MGEKRRKREKRKPAVTEFIAGDNVTVRVRGKIPPGERQWIEAAAERLERDLDR